MCGVTFASSKKERMIPDPAPLAQAYTKVAYIEMSYSSKQPREVLCVFYLFILCICSLYSVGIEVGGLDRTLDRTASNTIVDEHNTS